MKVGGKAEFVTCYCHPMQTTTHFCLIVSFFLTFTSRCRRFDDAPHSIRQWIPSCDPGPRFGLRIRTVGVADKSSAKFDTISFFSIFSDLDLWFDATSQLLATHTLVPTRKFPFQSLLLLHSPVKWNRVERHKKIKIK